MTIRFQADNDLNRLIVAATVRREPALSANHVNREAPLERARPRALVRRPAGPRNPRNPRFVLSVAALPRCVILNAVLLAELWESKNDPKNQA